MNALTKLPDASLNESRSSDSIAAEIERLNGDLAHGRARIDLLVSNYDADILKGDKEAEANEAETAGTRRTVRRIELRLIDLNAELVTSQEYERISELSKKQEAAKVAVEAVIASFDAKYRKPARQIAAFLKELQAADQLAFEAGVPSVHKLTRVVPQRNEPNRMEEQTFYIDEFGCETDQAYPAGAYRKDAEGQLLNAAGQRLSPRPARTRMVEVRGAITPELWLDGLDALVNLPGATVGDDAHWKGSAIGKDKRR